MSTKAAEAHLRAVSAAGEWPSADLEALGRCPICGGAHREEAYAGLSDCIFGAQGIWTYQRCACGILYLDPRPTERSIGRAYGRYHTHDYAPREFAWRRRGLRGALSRGMLNRRYGYGMQPASWLGAVTSRFRCRAARNLDYMIRHLPPPARAGLTILDVGCGNGDFLAVAEDLGYSVRGIDFDERAVELARGRGFDVRLARLPRTGETPGTFDHIFLSHVLEHLHHPREALYELRRLLAPGGRVWISQPNLAARGLARFGSEWRGLEPPRHLVLFAPDRLSNLLMELGFAGVRLLPAEEAAHFYYRHSQAIRCGLDPYQPGDPPDWDRIETEARAANRLALSNPARGETVTIIAFAPND